MVNVGSSTSISLSDNGQGTFYSDSGCSIPVTSVTITASQQNFYFSDNSAETLTLSASHSGLTTGTLNVTASASSASMFVFSGARQQAVAGSCAAYTVTSEDAFGNVAAVATDRVVTLSGNGHGAYYSDSGCTSSVSSFIFSSGTSTHAIYFMDAASESVIFSAKATGFTEGKFNVTVNPGTASQLILSGPGSTTAGACNTLTIAAQDGSGNTANVGADTTITLSGAGSSGAFYTTNGCSTTTTSATISTGSNSQTVYFKATVAGSLSLSASATRFSNGALSVTVQPATASQIALLGQSSIRRKLRQLCYIGTGCLLEYNDSRIPRDRCTFKLGSGHLL